jgi:hypothetical protein
VHRSKERVTQVLTVFSSQQGMIEKLRRAYSGRLRWLKRRWFHEMNMIG